MGKLIVADEDDLRTIIRAALREAADEAALRPATATAQITPETSVLGLDPHALYSRASLATRWDVSADTVRKIPADELPSVSWRGGHVRYRGADVLRYEGLSQCEIDGGAQPTNVVPGPWSGPILASASASADRPVSADARSASPRLGRAPKGGRLPQL